MMKEMIYGSHAVLEWIKSGYSAEKILMAKGLSPKRAEEFMSPAREKNIPVKVLSRFELTQLCGHDRHQGIAAYIELPSYSELDDIFNKADKAGEKPLFIALDGVADPHNLGAVLRSADGAGFHGVIIPKDNAAGLSAAVLKTSAGAALHVPVVRVTNLARTLQELKKEGIWVFGTDQNEGRLYTDGDYASGTVIVMGSEGRGLRRLVREQCDFFITIPMRGKVESLNVSVSAALCMYAARKQRTDSV